MPGFVQPSFGGDGRLVSDGSITTAQAAEMQLAGSWTAPRKKSSNVHRFRWKIDNGRPTLSVWFRPVDEKTGKVTGPESVYHWPGAEFSWYQRFKEAPSAGKFVAHVLRKALGDGIKGTVGD